MTRYELVRNQVIDSRGKAATLPTESAEHMHDLIDSIDCNATLTPESIEHVKQMVLRIAYAFWED